MQDLCGQEGNTRRNGLYLRARLEYADKRTFCVATVGIRKLWDIYFSPVWSMQTNVHTLQTRVELIIISKLMSIPCRHGLNAQINKHYQLTLQLRKQSQSVCNIDGWYAFWLWWMVGLLVNYEGICIVFWFVVTLPLNEMRVKITIKWE